MVCEEGVGRVGWELVVLREERGARFVLCGRQRCQELCDGDM